ncbi:MAG: DsrE family protein [bacterium]
MAHIGFLLTKSPVQFRFDETVYHLSLALLNSGHSVSVFLFLDGVHGAIKPQINPEISVLPKDRIEELNGKGVRFLACGTCADAPEGDQAFVPGVKFGSFADFADLLGEVDRLISL